MLEKSFCLQHAHCSIKKGLAVITSSPGALIAVPQLQILMEQKSSLQLKEEKDPLSLLIPKTYCYDTTSHKPFINMFSIRWCSSRTQERELEKVMTQKQNMVFKHFTAVSLREHQPAAHSSPS